MITLGIETSCDETAVAILKEERVLAESLASSAKLHENYGGVVPEIASRHHLEVIVPCLDQALKQAKITLSQVDLIAVTQGPGLMGSLLVGVSAAKSLAISLRKPIVTVDHVIAHAFSGTLAERKSLFPFMGMVVSGGHTLLIHWSSLARLKVIGCTHDDAAGEAFDKVAQMLRLGYPGGPLIDRLSKKGNPQAYRFPRPWMREAHDNFSFSGLKTSVLYKLRSLEKRRRLRGRQVADVAASFQEAACEVLSEKSLRACVKHRVKSLVVGGGVSANTRLREMLLERSKEKGVRVIFPTMRLSLDNAVMIAATGRAIYKQRGAKRKRYMQTWSFEPYSDFFVQKHQGIG